MFRPDADSGGYGGDSRSGAGDLYRARQPRGMRDRGFHPLRQHDRAGQPADDDQLCPVGRRGAIGGNRVRIHQRHSDRPDCPARRVERIPEIDLELDRFQPAGESDRVL